MTVTSIHRIFFPWNEFNAMCEFESTHEHYRKIAEDSIGVTYECRTDYTVNLNKEES